MTGVWEEAEMVLVLSLLSSVLAFIAWEKVGREIPAQVPGTGILKK